MRVNIITSNLDTKDRIRRAKEAAHCLELILNSKQFRDRIIGMPPKWRVGSTGRFKYEDNEYIYETIMSGNEEWNGENDQEMDIIVDDYSRPWSKVVGYMVPGQPKTWVNTKYFDNMPLIKIVSNFMHEYFHHLGMRHGGDQFRWSIPYYANEVVEDIFYEVCDVEPPEYRKVCSGWWIFRRCRYVKVN